ncbi:MAG TPA: hypothetical protein DCS67_02520 [Clostridiales bacterium UBA8960]|nr:hypothetical protein [Clostridiales bacterium UBA8960]
MKRGLTIGKFAPLHKGHQKLIEHALSEMDELYVIVYDAPNLINIPLSLRAAWLKKIYPEVIVIEAKDVPKDVGWTEEIQQKHEDYVLSLIEGVSIDAFYSSEAYGFRMSKALNCKNVVVDLGRYAISISGTQIRESLFENRHFLNPIVYSDFITKVAVLGESEGQVRIIINHLGELNNTIAAFNPECDDVTHLVYGSNQVFFAGFSHMDIPVGFDLYYVIDDGLRLFHNHMDVPVTKISGSVEAILSTIQDDLTRFRKFR